jgi:hypothetical protein
VVFYNVNGFWNTLLDVLSEYGKGGFVRGNIEQFMAVANNIDELEMLIKEVI